MKGHPPEKPLHRAAPGFEAYRINSGIPAEPVCFLLQVPDGIADVPEVEGLAMSKPASELEPVVILINNQDSAGAHEPSAPGGEQADRSSPEDNH